MQKLIIAILFVFIFTSAHAQLGALKAKRDAANETVQEGSADNNNGYTVVNNVSSLLTKKIFSVIDYTVEDVNNAVAQSLAISQLEKAYKDTRWNFFEGDFLYLNGVGSVHTYKFTVNGNTISMKLGNETYKATVFNKGTKYRFVGTIDNFAGNVVLLMEGNDKVGDETLTSAELAKQSFTYLAKNGDYYKTTAPAFINGDNHKWYFEPQKNNEIVIYHLNRSYMGYDKDDLEVYTANLNNIDISSFKVAYADWFSSIPLQISSYNFKSYVGKEQKVNTTKSSKIILSIGELRCSNANSLLESISKSLPADKLAVFKAATPKRLADLSERIKAEKQEDDKRAAERAKEAEHFVTVSLTSMSWAPAVISETPVGSDGGRCSYQTYSFERNSRTGNPQTRMLTFCKGSVIKNVTTGQVIFTATPDMRGKEIKF